MTREGDYSSQHSVDALEPQPFTLHASVVFLQKFIAGTDRVLGVEWIFSKPQHVLEDCNDGVRF